jgi:hypothetical protein
MGEPRTDAEKYALEIKRHRLGWAALLVAAVGMVVGFGTLTQTCRNVANTQTAYELANRAWISVIPSPDSASQLHDDHGRPITPPALASLAESGQYRVALFIKNTGRSPALNVRYKSAVAFTNKIPTAERDSSAFVNATIVFPDAVITLPSNVSPPLRIDAERTRTRDAGPDHRPGLFIAVTICYDSCSG